MTIIRLDNGHDVDCNAPDTFKIDKIDLKTLPSCPTVIGDV